MSIYLYRPPYCPMCETSELLKRQFFVGPRAVVRYRCPRCAWVVEGRDPEVPPVLLVSPLAALDEAEELDEPMRRHYGPVERVPLPYPVFGEPRA